MSVMKMNKCAAVSGCMADAHWPFRLDLWAGWPGYQTTPLCYLVSVPMAICYFTQILDVFLRRKILQNICVYFRWLDQRFLTCASFSFIWPVTATVHWLQCIEKQNLPTEICVLPKWLQPLCKEEMMHHSGKHIATPVLLHKKIAFFQQQDCF